jgi:hypothetical protein
MADLYNIDIILKKNKNNDLISFLDRRKCLNKCNLFLIYTFHFIQTIGILIISYATSINNMELIWIGIAFNSVASLINIYEKININILKKLMNDIILIKNDKYIDDSAITNIIIDKNNKTGDISDDSDNTDNKQYNTFK